MRWSVCALALALGILPSIEAEAMVLACANGKGTVKVTIDEEKAEAVYEQPPGERWHYINGAFRSVCEPCNIIGQSLSLPESAQNVVIITNEKIIIGTKNMAGGWVIDRDTGAMDATGFALDNFTCRLANRPF